VSSEYKLTFYQCLINAVIGQVKPAQIHLSGASDGPQGAGLFVVRLRDYN